MREDNIIAGKSLDFAVRIVHLYKHLKDGGENVISKQLLKCGTSIGANVREAVGAQSKADFVAKMHIALKEVYETEYWLELLHKTNFIDDKGYKSIFTDCRELTNIIARIVKTTKERK